MQVLEIIESVGVRFESANARELFKNRGARVEGDNVFIPRHLIEEALESTPKQDYSITTKKRIIAATPFGTAPFILDDDTGPIHRCNIGDAVRFYQINETSSLYECANPGCADPLGNDAPDQFVAQIAMTLKYSDKYPSIGLRPTGSNSKKGDFYGSARRALRLVREFYDVWDEPVMTQGICPNPPLAYDRECLDNLNATIDEQQVISIITCSVGFMTGPESIMGTVIHDFAMSLAGFACGSFYKTILDEEMIRYSNRMLQGVEMTIDPKLPELLAAGREAGSFLGIGSMETYRRDNYLTKIFNK